MTGIVDIQLRRLEKLLADRKLTLELDDAAKRWLADAGYDPVYGARPLKRVIQRELQNPLAMEILEGRIREGDTVRVTVGPSGLQIEPLLARAACGEHPAEGDAMGADPTERYARRASTG